MSKNTPFDEIDKRCSNQAFYKKFVDPKEQILTRWESKDLPKKSKITAPRKRAYSRRVHDDPEIPDKLDRPAHASSV